MAEGVNISILSALRPRRRLLRKHRSPQSKIRSEAISVIRQAIDRNGNGWEGRYDLCSSGILMNRNAGLGFSRKGNEKRNWTHKEGNYWTGGCLRPAEFRVMADDGRTQR